jgi:IS605 OrfB family transposase
MSVIRPIADPFVVAPPSGVRVLTRLRVSVANEAVLREVGWHLGSLAGRDLAARCREGRMDARQRAESRRERKRALTAESSSRWAGAITRTSEDQYRRAEQNLWDERASLLARIRRIQARLAVPVGGCDGAGRRRVRGYASAAERHAKTVRLQTLRTRLGEVESRLQTGRVSVVRGGKALLHKRNNLDAAGLSEAQWRQEWEPARLFLTADGEKDKTWGNETIRWNPDQQWLEIKLPAPLAHLANRPHGRYRLSCPVTFPYQGERVAAQAATGAVRYDVTRDPCSGRWYLHASWKHVKTVPPPLDELRCHRVVSVDVNDAHLDVAVIAPDGNPLATPVTFDLVLAGLPATTRDARLRTVISRILNLAAAHDAKAVVIENLDFAQARQQGREHVGNRPSGGRRGRRYRRVIAGIPTAQLRDRLTQMAYNAGIAVIAVDPAYTSRWGAQHWGTHLKRHHQSTGRHAAALVIGRRGLGHRARRRVTGNHTAPAEAARSTQTRPRTIPAPGTAPRKPATPTGHRQPHRTKTGRPRQGPAGNQATQDRSGPPHTQDSLLTMSIGTVSQPRRPR